MDGKPKLVAFDLDGTLAVSKTPMTAEMGQLLARLMLTTPVAVLSGASFKQFETQFLPGMPAGAQLDNLYLFPMNASACFAFAQGAWQTLYSETFTAEERATILHALDEAMKQTGFDVPPPHVWGERIEDRGGQITFSGLGQQAPAEEKKRWDTTRAKRKPLYDALLARLPEFSIGLNAATSIDITRKGVNKAYGVRKLSGITGIPVSEMLYVGDALGEGGNDSVVIPTGVHTQAVSGPEETAKIIESLL